MITVDSPVLSHFSHQLKVFKVDMSCNELHLFGFIFCFGSFTCAGESPLKRTSEPSQSQSLLKRRRGSEVTSCAAAVPVAVPAVEQAAQLLEGAQPFPTHKTQLPSQEVVGRAGEGEEKRAGRASAYHRILGVRVGATEAELKVAYSRKAANLHPDTPTGNSKDFRKFLTAYQALLNDVKQNPVACARPTEWITSPGLLLLLLRETNPEEWQGLLAAASYECLFDALDLVAQESLKTVLSPAQDIWEELV